jgi:hypothetical protein
MCLVKYVKIDWGCWLESFVQVVQFTIYSHPPGGDGRGGWGSVPQEYTNVIVVRVRLQCVVMSGTCSNVTLD